MPRDPIILAFDTSAAHCAAALLCGETVLAENVEPMHKGQAERLMPLIEEMLTKANLTWADLGVIGVGIGPGNFTGIRISVAAARGLALSLGIPSIGVSTFEALAYGISGTVVTTVAAPRDMLYLQLFDENVEHLPSHCTLETLPPLPNDRPFTLIGPYTAEIAAKSAGTEATPAYSLPVATGKVAMDRRLDSNPRPAPLYIRAADAAPPRDAAPTILD